LKKTTEKNNTNRRATFKYAKSAGPTKNRGAQEACGGKDFFVLISCLPAGHSRQAKHLIC